MHDDAAWHRRYDALRARASQFADQFGTAFGAAFGAGFDAARTASTEMARPVVLSISSAPPRTETEICLLTALSLAGWETVPVVMMQADVVGTYYDLLGATRVLHWHDRLPDADAFMERAAAALAPCTSFDDLLRIVDGTVRVGGHAAAMARRQWRRGRIDLGSPSMRADLERFLARSFAATAACRAILREFRPSMLLAVDTVYTPKGEILDCCLEAGVPVVRWYPAHRGDTLMLKRYTASNRDHDLNSLSDASWRAMCEMPWSPALRARVDEELRGSYASGQWYGESGTQFDRRLVAAEIARERLQLAPSTPTAFVFAHISWDASFGRGRDLFESYEEWLVETVRAACDNPSVQWIVKIHPAHVGKSAIDFWRGEPSEVAILRERIGDLPPHVRILPADTELSTHSLFSVMDVAVTVRGTAGLEAARLGIPVITGGTGRYDGKGFTVDSQTSAEYLQRILHAQLLPRLTPEQVELADRYAYGLFCRRPLALSTMTLEYEMSHGVDTFYNRVRVHNRSLSDWQRAPDLSAFAHWAVRSHDEDFLMPLTPP